MIANLMMTFVVVSVLDSDSDSDSPNFKLELIFVKCSTEYTRIG